MKKKKVPASVPYKPQLLEDLKDSSFAAEYLTACAGNFETDEDFEVFFSALQEIVEANGYTDVAKKMNRSRDALHKMFKAHRNPTISTLGRLLGALDLGVAIVPKRA